MSENEKINLSSLQVNLDEEKSVRLVAEQLSELKKNGYKQVTIEIKVASEQELERFELDIATFERIKNTQELPDWVVINLMLAGGKLKGTKYKARVFNE